MILGNTGRMDETLVVFTRQRVLTLTGLTAAQLNYWADTQLVVPAIDRRLTPGRIIRLYNYEDLFTLLIIVELRARGISVQYIRQIVDYVRREGFHIPQLVFAVVGKRVHFQTPDGVWQDAERAQTVASQLLDLTPLRARIQASVGRRPEAVGRIERRSGTMGNKEVIAG